MIQPLASRNPLQFELISIADKAYQLAALCLTYELFDQKWLMSLSAERTSLCAGVRPRAISHNYSNVGCVSPKASGGLLRFQRDLHEFAVFQKFLSPKSTAIEEIGPNYIH